MKLMLMLLLNSGTNNALLFAAWRAASSVRMTADRRVSCDTFVESRAALHSAVMSATTSVRGAFVNFA